VVIILTQWESEADLDASESAADKVRADALEVLGGQGTVDRYEQMVWETVGAGPGPGAKLLIRALQMDPSAVDDNVAFFKETVLPEIKSAPGILAVRNLINRQTGQGRVATVWADEESRSGYVAGNESRQARAESRGITFTGDMSLEILLAAMR
jgi:heme-degrading monooxygenase HmoA